MYQAHWLDMAPKDATPQPLDRDGDGAAGGSLSNVEQIALMKSGLTVEEYLALADNQRDKVLTKAMKKYGAVAAQKAADAAPGTPGTQEPEKAAGGPETPAGGDLEADAGAGSDADPAAAEAGGTASEGDAASSPADTVIVAYKCFGFGAYYGVNAGGEKITGKFKKQAAEGFASSAAVPLLGQDAPLPGAE
jgi:hypothetical protein